MEAVIAFWLIGMVIMVYFAPTVVAFARHHANAWPIAVINLFLGWTLLGWAGSLAWSLTRQTPRASGR